MTNNYAEKIFRGGTIITMDDDCREVEAVAIAGGRIILAGSEAEVMNTRNDATIIVELGNHTLMPSFIDAHSHFMNAPQVVKWANVSGLPVGPVTCINDIITVLKEHSQKLQIKPGDWIIGYGYDVTNLSDSRECSRDDLDPHFPDNPVMLIHCSNHGAVLNSKAFNTVGMNANTETPPGGMILRKDGSNEPDGLIMETAFIPIFIDIPKPTEEELLNTLDEAQQIYAKVGVTTCQEGATNAKDLKFLLKAAEEGRFYLDIVALPFIAEVPALIKEYFPSFSGGPTEIPDVAKNSFGNYKNRFKLAGIKLTLDGSPQGKTAFWSQPLLTPGPGGETNWRGQPIFPPELINKVVQELVEKDIPIFSHCNGDAAIDMMIDAAKLAGIKASDDRRTVIIHSQFMRPEQLDSYVELGFSPSFFTLHAFFWGSIHQENLGVERANFLSPIATATQKGICCSNHTDFSVTPMEPMWTVWSAVERKSRDGSIIGENERIDRWEAFKAITINAAWQIREENEKGTIQAGKLADLVILDQNPFTVNIDDLINIQVVETLKEGKTVYQR